MVSLSKRIETQMAHWEAGMIHQKDPQLPTGHHEQIPHWREQWVLLSGKRACGNGFSCGLP